LTGRVLGAEGDDLFLFQRFSAENHLNNGGVQWTDESLSAALADVNVQDRGRAIAPGGMVPAFPAPCSFASS